MAFRMNCRVLRFRSSLSEDDTPVRVRSCETAQREPGGSCLKSLDPLKSTTAALWRLGVWPALPSNPLKRPTFLKLSKRGYR
jgi:hypothetical protein